MMTVMDGPIRTPKRMPLLPLQVSEGCEYPSLVKCSGLKLIQVGYKLVVKKGSDHVMLAITL